MFILTHLTSRHQKHAVEPVVFLPRQLTTQWWPIKLNCTIHVQCTILKLVAASAAGAELGALFLNAQEKVFCLMLAKLDHPQPPATIYIDNTKSVV
jgi:hypothetical protein